VLVSICHGKFLIWIRKILAKNLFEVFKNEYIQEAFGVLFKKSVFVMILAFKKLSGKPFA
jgi:hypothetical protein